MIKEDKCQTVITAYQAVKITSYLSFKGANPGSETVTLPFIVKCFKK
jgi:hypothetical protein